MSNEQVSYSHRSSVLTDNRAYRIEESALVWRDGEKAEVSLLYTDILSIEALYSPSRVQANRYLMKLKTVSQGIISVTNTTYKGVGDFKELNETYVLFVIELHRKAVERNPSLLFKQGSSWLGYIFSILVTVALLIIIIGAGLFFLMTGMVWIAVIKLVILIIFFPRLIRYVKRNRPRVYDPLNLPANVLPELPVA